MNMDNFRDQLASDADNYDVWCERCQRVHKYFTYTKEDHDRVIREGVQKLSDEIDARVFAFAMDKLYGDGNRGES